MQSLVGIRRSDDLTQARFSQEGWQRNIQLSYGRNHPPLKEHEYPGADEVLEPLPDTDENSESEQRPFVDDEGDVDDSREK